jgi:hypothetical protein
MMSTLLSVVAIKIATANFSPYACIGIKLQGIYDYTSDNLKNGVVHFDMRRSILRRGICRQSV